MNSSVSYDSMDRRGIEGFLKAKIRHTPVWRTVLLSLITFGVYLPFWLLTRRQEVNRIAGTTVMKKRFIIMILVGYIFSALMYTVGPFFINEVALMLYDYIDIFITYFGLAVILFYSFRIRSVLMKEEGGEPINAILTFIFTIWYLQYHINKRY